MSDFLILMVTDIVGSVKSLEVGVCGNHLTLSMPPYEMQRALVEILNYPCYLVVLHSMPEIVPLRNHYSVVIDRKWKRVFSCVERLKPGEGAIVDLVTTVWNLLLIAQIHREMPWTTSDIARELIEKVTHFKSENSCYQHLVGTLMPRVDCTPMKVATRLKLMYIFRMTVSEADKKSFDGIACCVYEDVDGQRKIQRFDLGNHTDITKQPGVKPKRASPMKHTRRNTGRLRGGSDRMRRAARRRDYTMSTLDEESDEYNDSSDDEECTNNPWNIQKTEDVGNEIVENCPIFINPCSLSLDFSREETTQKPSFDSVEMYKDLKMELTIARDVISSIQMRLDAYSNQVGKMHETLQKIEKFKESDKRNETEGIYSLENSSIVIVTPEDSTPVPEANSNDSEGAVDAAKVNKEYPDAKTVDPKCATDVPDVVKKDPAQ